MTDLSGENLNNRLAVDPQGAHRNSPSTFPNYPVYMDSGFEWLGDVPESWNVASIKFFADLITGITPPSDDLSNYAEEGWLWVRPEDLDDSGKPVLASRFLTDQGWNFCRRVKGESTLICCIGTIGKLGFVDVDVCTNQQITAVVPRQSGRFYFYAMHALKSAFDANATGNVLRILNSERLGSVAMAVPSQDEAESIARFLDHETARIDALIEEQQRLIELLKEKRQAVISLAVTKGLDPTVSMKDSGVEWLGEVPAHWEVKQLKHVVDPNTSITYGIVQAGPEFEGGIPYIRTSDMSGEELPVSGYPLTSPDIDESYARSRVRPGDIVMSIRASVGKCLPVPDQLKVANLTQGTAKISAGQDITRNFLLAFLNAGATQNYFDLMAKGATFKEITLDALRRTPVLLPPVNEQINIDQLVSKHTGLLDEICKQAIQSVSLLKERRSALISAAVTGKIDVRCWQPPASAPSPELAQEAV